MSSVKMSYSLALLLLLALQFSFIDSIELDQPETYCNPNLAFDCATDGENNATQWIWTLDENNMCRPYLSECVFKQVNCDRYFKNRETYKVVEDYQCPISKCFNACYEEPKEDICALTKENTYPCYFTNKCALSTYLCKKRKNPFYEVTYFQDSCGDDARTCEA